ncbi:hypothetical protein [Bordetella avium]|uniref:hypothetical protein n=1 Tax=Bordetella avium TaxID=521 RepID=UPI0011C3B6D4|nr:hypothetical protein [Bordetella avium]
MKIHAWCCLEVPDSATPEKTRNDAGFAAFHALSRRSIPDDESLPLYCKQDIFIFYIQWLIFLLIGNTMKNTMLRKGLTIF